MLTLVAVPPTLITDVFATTFDPRVTLPLETTVLTVELPILIADTFAVTLAPIFTAELILAVPVTVNSESGEELFIPTRLFVESTKRVLVDTAIFPEYVTRPEVNVVLPDTASKPVKVVFEETEKLTPFTITFAVLTVNRAFDTEIFADTVRLFPATLALLALRVNISPVNIAFEETLSNPDVILVFVALNVTSTTLEVSRDVEVLLVKTKMFAVAFVKRVLEEIVRVLGVLTVPPLRELTTTSVFAEKEPLTYAFPDVIPPEELASVVTTFVERASKSWFVLLSQSKKVSEEELTLEIGIAMFVS
jgi:hypothetical protein